jgi:hypothetical protein
MYALTSRELKSVPIPGAFTKLKVWRICAARKEYFMCYVRQFRKQFYGACLHSYGLYILPQPLSLLLYHPIQFSAWN